MNREFPETVRLVMIRQNLENVPRYELPQGHSLRWYRTGDECSWLEIHLKADLWQPINEGLFVRQFGQDADRLGRRQVYLLDSSLHPIGTATAWFNDDFHGTRIGRVHWLAIVPPYQGRALSKPLLAAVCSRLKELGHEQAYLTTSNARRTAINLYLRFGFKPLVENELQAAAWRQIPGFPWKA